ncbi:carboxylic acid transporter [Pochonia chlamydosporia 170]|uniref:Carboxylic acid transporter n=1 Tax=Pochonia chlamydosporia 170 TaxID=1380566 RepID=A0A179F5E9_METCM|nr:carboxylic acid transporter [Pochonia chlamydosporia 170]OAQ60656.1 carboxylic acid transporter [Pochonia chlamydosporia 170]
MRNHMEAGWFYSPRQIARYAATRVTSLKPPKARVNNPVRVLAELNGYQWSMFFLGFIAWVWDAVDFFTVSLALTEIAKDFGVENSEVSWGITVSLMLRSVGALTFGAFADRYGCKWPMIVALGLFVILELASGFCQTLPQFLAVRSLYGIAMGGMYGPAASTALSDLPYDARGVLSGLYQNGYSTGYLLACVFYRALVPTTSHGWRSLFWFCSVPPLFIIVFRWYMPETCHFKALKASREAQVISEQTTQEPSATRSRNTTKYLELAAFAKESARAIRQNWVLFIYMVIMMTGFNSCSHGSQDFFPTYLKSQVNLDATQVVIISVVGQLGSITGGTILGYISTYSGRRLIMLIACICGGALVPAYIIPRSMVLVATAFFEQVFVGGVWGPIPIHLMELSPPALRTTVVGLTYQLGNLASSACATIQAIIGERFPLAPGPHGEKRFDYGKVIAIFMGSVWAFLFVLLLIGPEMTQGERDAEAEAARNLERLRLDGMNLDQVQVVVAEKQVD